jgi:hypothetical protein
LFIVNKRVDARVNASSNVIWLPVVVIGNPIVCPLVCNVAAEFADRVVVFEPAVYVIPVGKLNAVPNIVRTSGVSVPVNPVKFKLLTLPLNATISVPAVMLTFGAVADECVPNVIVRVPVDPEYVKLTVGVPVYDQFVDVEVVQTVALFPVILSVLVPNIIDLVLELELEYAGIDKSLPFKFKLPAV